MRYQDIKLRHTARLASLALAFTAVATVCLANLSLLRGRVQGLVGGIAVIAALAWAIVAWALLTCPAQNAQFASWAAKTLRVRAPPGFDWRRMDAADPDGRVLTIVYLMRRLRAGRRRWGS